MHSLEVCTADDGGRCETNVDLANELKLIREQLTTIAREMVSFRQEITNINSNVSEISNRVSDVEKRIACLKQQATDLPSQPGASKVEDSIAELKCRLMGTHKRSPAITPLFDGVRSK
ncbi:unnamed protein product [Parnassius apollo]|uniref:(apollo) hypothetical protein n=1 Tax=Parnassius apollo TaxID=110799 RepID=A0A8S3Y7E2_PARAO|nr:unnamed protein product [Parnassius apollo]